MDTIRVTGGLIEGVQEEGFVSFKGVPYAAPPVGERRWKLPEPVIPWKGVKKCDRFGSPCCQAPNQCVPGGDPADRGVLEQGSEDCLYLNVWTPDPKAEKLPVFIWIHGGAFCCGSGAGKAAKPDTFVSRGIVYVSLNYRLGILGYFAHPDLSAENEHHVSGNYAHYDQLAALKWIRENIAAFGGDPDNITIGGCSAGAGSTQCLCVSPLSRGLFSQAIVMSSWSIMVSSYPEDFILRNREEMEERGKEFMALNGCNTIAELRAKSYAELAATPDSSFRKKYHYGTVMGTSKDGYITPKLPRIAAQDFDSMNIPYMIGCTNDEGAGFMPLLGMDRFLKDSEAVFGNYMEAYCQTWKTLPNQDISTIANATHLKLAGEKAYAAVSASLGRRPVYVYDFCRQATAPGGRKAAYHGLDTHYMFGSQRKLPNTNEDDDVVAHFVQEYWCNFIKYGNPNGKDLPEWKPYDEKDRNVMYINVEPKLQKDADAENPVMEFTRNMLEEKLRKGLK